LKDAFDNSDEEEEATEAIFRKLRPQSKYRFSDVLRVQDKDPRMVNRMIGPMGVARNEQQLQQAHMEPLMGLNTGSKKKKIERHRFAGPPANARVMHNLMMRSNE
jgi:hypothetical protein